MAHNAKLLARELLDSVCKLVKSRPADKVVDDLLSFDDELIIEDRDLWDALAIRALEHLPLKTLPRVLPPSDGGLTSVELLRSLQRMAEFQTFNDCDLLKIDRFWEAEMPAGQKLRLGTYMLLHREYRQLALARRRLAKCDLSREGLCLEPLPCCVEHYQSLTEFSWKKMMGSPRRIIECASALEMIKEPLEQWITLYKLMLTTADNPPDDSDFHELLLFFCGERISFTVTLPATPAN